MKDEQQHEIKKPEPKYKFEGFERVYIDIKTPGSVWKHNLVNRTTMEDYVEIYEVATYFARQGCTVMILPILENPDDPLRASLFNGAKPNKCPDLDVDGEFVDVKCPVGESLNTIDNNIRKAHRQADYIVIKIAAQVPFWKLEFAAKKRFEKHRNLHTIVFIIVGGETYIFERD